MKSAYHLPRTATPRTIRARPLPAADDPIWLLGHDVVRAAWELLSLPEPGRERRSEVCKIWG